MKAQQTSPDTDGQQSFLQTGNQDQVLVGIRVNRGAFIDAVTPLFATVDAQGNLGSAIPWNKYGGVGGDRQDDLIMQDHVVVGLQTRVGGHDHDGHLLTGLRIIWRSWGPHGVESGNDIMSPWIGSTSDPVTVDWRADNGYAAIGINGYVGSFGWPPPMPATTVLVQGLGLIARQVTVQSQSHGLDVNADMIVAIVGAIVLISLLVAMWRSPPVHPGQVFVLRVVVALAGAACAAAIPGMLTLQTSESAILTIRATGALAVFALFYLVTPRLADLQQPADQARPGLVGESSRRADVGSAPSEPPSTA